MKIFPNRSTFLQNIAKYIFDFIVVFAGVFLAFWLSELKDQRNEAQKKKEIYIAIYEDLSSFHESGMREYDKGFVNFFEGLDHTTDSLVLSKQIPPKLNLYGDYWKIPIINSLIQSGMVKDIDIMTFKKVARFNVLHQNLLENIKVFNDFYDKYITAEYDQGMDHYYVAGTNQLKPKYSYLNEALAGIAEFSELLVNISYDLSVEIDEKYIKNK